MSVKSLGIIILDVGMCEYEDPWYNYSERKRIGR